MSILARAPTSTRTDPIRPHTVSHSGRYVLSHRLILLRVTRNELVARYAGSVLGVGWALLTPLVMIAIYAVVYLVPAAPIIEKVLADHAIGSPAAP